MKTEAVKDLRVKGPGEMLKKVLKIKGVARVQSTLLENL
jgi:uncharacterized Zn ribbon protein